MAAPRYRAAKQHELARALKLGGGGRGALREVLRRLESEGRVASQRNNRWALARSDRLVTGLLSIHPSGFGFVTPAGVAGSDVYVERDEMAGALHGDRVMVEIRGRPRGDRRSGRVLRIVERAERLLTGTLQRGRGYWYLVPDDPRIPQNVILDGDIPESSPAGQKVAVQLDVLREPGTGLHGTLHEILGPAGAPGVDMLMVLRSHGLYEQFEESVQDEARQRQPALTKADLQGRLDLRDEHAVTIDPADAKDHDDAVSLVRLDQGWRLGVHIADVSHFVQPGTEVDREARRRGNSVYLVDRFIPMLPKYLTTEICSLRPHVDRLTHSVILDLDEQGRVLRTKTAASVIHSRARLNYDQVQALLDNRADHGIPEELVATVTDMAALAGKLRRDRMRAGALDLNMPEVTCELDQNGEVIDIHKRGAPEAYHLIEEFMLMANVAVAQILARSGGPALYRIHEEPSEEQWAAMATQLTTLGLPASPTDRKDLQEICHRVDGKPVAYAAQLAILRNLKRALYSPERVEHFGLAFATYTHFTSPIRRYPDLLVHRLLKAIELRRPPPHNHDEIDSLCAHCSQTERNADEAETESLAVKRIAFYERLLKEGEIGPYAGLVVAILPKGLIVEVLDTLQRGLVPFPSMGDDYYQVSDDRCRAVGKRSRHAWTLGQPVQVELVRVDPVRRLIDFRLASASQPAAPRARKKQRRQRMR